MAQRLELQAILEGLIGHVYFQPPSTIKMEYPCIVYKRDDLNTRYAGNKAYSRKKRYQITIIDRNPDSEVCDKVAELPLCAFDRAFVSDNLNHDIYNLFF